jgi:transcriptional regulator with XRE-family HTH domain
MTEEKWLWIFKDTLSEMMIDRGMTQKELASRAGLSEASVSNYLNARQFPTVRAVINLSYALGCNLEELVDYGKMIL